MNMEESEIKTIKTMVKGPLGDEACIAPFNINSGTAMPVLPGMPRGLTDNETILNRLLKVEKELEKVEKELEKVRRVKEPHKYPILSFIFQKVPLNTGMLPIRYKRGPKRSGRTLIPTSFASFGQAS